MSINDPDWIPATSKPGETFTIEGRIRSIGVFARNLKSASPRGRSYRRQMLANGVRVALLTGFVIAVVALILQRVA